MTGIPTISAFGDSITAQTGGNWLDQVVAAYQHGANQFDHSAGSSTIVSQMAGQVAAASSDNADIALVAFGANDDNSGDMGALQSEYETDVATLKSSNPNARIIALNVWKVWNGVGVEQDKSNIRTAVSAACASQGIECVSTYTWRDFTDTLDGVHNAASGNSKVYAQVVALL